MSDYTAELAAVRELVELGAVHVKVGDLEASFPMAHGEPAPVDLPPMTEEEETAAWEREQYWSS